MPIGSREKVTLLNTSADDALSIANAIGTSGLVMPISTMEQVRVDVSRAQVLVLCLDSLQVSVSLSVHSWMALQMLLSTPERRVYLALPEKALIPPVVYLYRIMVIDPSSPTFLLVHETLWDHTIEILDPALL